METLVKERPILFSGPMVRALLAGTKTQTRRAVKPQPENGIGYVNGNFILHSKIVDGVHLRDSNAKNIYSHVRCPYGKLGDRLWVRERFGLGEPDPYVYYATSGLLICGEGFRWKPSIHMPRAASRLLLEIVSVRVERLQDISEADAIAEGIEQTEDWGSDWTWYQDYLSESNQLQARESYASLWRKINGPESWTANPWVWVVEFKVVEPSK